MSAQCEMIIGYLVPHRCENNALGTCRQCGRSFCDEHLSAEPAGLICQACQQGLEQPVALPLTTQTYSAADLALFQAASSLDEENDTFADLS